MSAKKKPGIFSLLKPYKGLIFLLILLALAGNSINLVLPHLIAKGIDGYGKGIFEPMSMVMEFSIVIVAVFIFTFFQNIVQTYASERVARDLRTRLSEKISRQSLSFVEQADPSKLLTNLTSDVDSIKLFVSQAIVSITSSIFIILGASILLLNINWKLGLAIIAIIPIIGTTFYLVLKKVRNLIRNNWSILNL
jgi:ATP-binding cassette subfamily B protein